MEDTMVETVENNVAQEPQAEAQPGTTQPDDGANETQLTQEISDLWSNHLRLSADWKATAKELRQIRVTLSERLYAMKSLLCRPDRGRASMWRGWLRERGIPRSTADRLVARHAESLFPDSESVPSEQVSAPSTAEVADSVRQHLKQKLPTPRSAYRFLLWFVTNYDLGYEMQDNGILVLEPHEEEPSSVAAAPPAVEQPAAVADASNSEEAMAEPAVGTPAIEQVAGDGDNYAGAVV
jgi:hypothetical protein